jgi:hypothetical protein
VGDGVDVGVAVGVEVSVGLGVTVGVEVSIGRGAIVAVIVGTGSGCEAQAVSRRVRAMERKSDFTMISVQTIMPDREYRVNRYPCLTCPCLSVRLSRTSHD